MYKYKILVTTDNCKTYSLQEVEGHALDDQCACTKFEDGWEIHDLASGLRITKQLKSMNECKQYLEANKQLCEKKRKTDRYKEFVDIKNNLN